jgi:hypothetical protein
LLKTIDFILSYRYFFIFEKIIKLLKLKTPHELGTTSIIKRQGDTSKRLRIEQDTSSGFEVIMTVLFFRRL